LRFGDGCATRQQCAGGASQGQDSAAFAAAADFSPAAHWNLLGSVSVASAGGDCQRTNARA